MASEDRVTLRSRPTHSLRERQVLSAAIGCYSKRRSASRVPLGLLGRSGEPVGISTRDSRHSHVNTREADADPFHSYHPDGRINIWLQLSRSRSSRRLLARVDVAAVRSPVQVPTGCA